MTDTTRTTGSRPQVPRWLVRTIWIAHRAAYRITGGRFGLRTANPTRWGMLRLHTVGRRRARSASRSSATSRTARNLVTPAMNGWADPEPAWWLNLQANPEATVELPDGTRERHGAGRGRGGAGAAVASVRRPRLVPRSPTPARPSGPARRRSSSSSLGRSRDFAR